MNKPDYLAVANDFPNISSLSSFKDSIYDKHFSVNPFVFFDIGGRGGIHPVIAPFASHVSLAFFDADENIALSDLYFDPNNPPQNVSLWPFALGDSNKQEFLYHTADMAAASLLPPNMPLIERYSINRAKYAEKKSPLEVHSLDEIIIQNKGLTNPDFLKIDVQGYELDVLRGSERSLQESVCSLFVEVEFFQIYNNQPLFSEVEIFLRENGFVFLGFDTIHYRGTRNFETRKYPKTKERYCWADAVFIKDLNSLNINKLSKHNILSNLMSAILLGYHDFAIESACCVKESFDWFTDQDLLSTQDICKDLAFCSINTIKTDLDSLLQFANTNQIDNFKSGLAAFINNWRFNTDLL